MRKNPTILLAVCLFAVFSGLLCLFVAALGRHPSVLDSVVVGREITSVAAGTPDDTRISFILPRLDDGRLVGSDELPPPPYLLNIWGSWCDACHVEHSYLIQLQKRIPIIGINWPAGNRDERENALAFLAAKGDPYTLVLTDPRARLIIDLGVYGAPETFLVGADGKILIRHAGALGPRVWEKKFVPLIVH